MGDCWVRSLCRLQSYKRSGSNYPIEVPKATFMPLRIYFPIIALGMAAAMMPWLPLAAVVALAQSAEPKRETPTARPNTPTSQPVQISGNVVAFRR